jgi:hypothetical protein
MPVNMGLRASLVCEALVGKVSTRDAPRRASPSGLQLPPVVGSGPGFFGGGFGAVPDPTGSGPVAGLPLPGCGGGGLTMGGLLVPVAIGIGGLVATVVPPVVLGAFPPVPATVGGVPVPVPVGGAAVPVVVGPVPVAGVGGATVAVGVATVAVGVGVATAGGGVAGAGAFGAAAPFTGACGGFEGGAPCTVSTVQPAAPSAVTTTTIDGRRRERFIVGQE